MQSFQPVRERKINKAHREVVSNEDTFNIMNEKISVHTEKKKQGDINIAERKRKRISAQNEIVIPNLEEKFKISSNNSLHQNKINMELTSEMTPITKPKKYYDQEEIRKYIKEKRLSRKNSQENMDQVVPEKSKPKTYNVNEVREFMRKRVKAREEQHKKEILDKEKKSNEIKQRLEKLREFQKKQMNNNTIKSKTKNPSSLEINDKKKVDKNILKEKSPSVQKNNYLNSASLKNSKNDTIIINKLNNNNNDYSNTSLINDDLYSSASVYDNNSNAYSYNGNSEKENIPMKMKNDTYDELSKISNSDYYLENSSTTNFNEDYSIESLQSQAKRIQELIKNAEFLAQRIEQHTSKMPKSKESILNLNNINNKIINNHSSVIYEKGPIPLSFNNSKRDSVSSSSSSSNSNTNYNINPILSLSHSKNISNHSNNLSISKNTSESLTTKHENLKSLNQNSSDVLSNNDPKQVNEESILPNEILSNKYFLQEPSKSITKSIPSIKNKQKEKEPDYKINDVNDNSFSFSKSYDNNSSIKDNMSLDNSLDISFDSNSEIKLENINDITPDQWKIEISSPKKVGDNYSTINIFTRRFQPSTKDDLKKKSDSNNIYKKLIEKMEKEKEQLRKEKKENNEKNKIARNNMVFRLVQTAAEDGYNRYKKMKGHYYKLIIMHI